MISGRKSGVTNLLFSRIFQYGLFIFFGFLLALGIGSYIFWSALPSQAVSAPLMVTYQGRLLVNNQMATTSLSMKFVLYTAASGGTAIYSASGTVSTPQTITVTPTNGFFAINFGDTGTNSLDPSIFQSNQNLFLEVIIGGETLSPRKQITSAPFAFNAKYLDGVAATSTASSSTYIPISDSAGNFNFNGVTSTRLVVTGTSTLATTTITKLTATVTSSIQALGIGTTTPRAALDVVGNIKNIISRGQLNILSTLNTGDTPNSVTLNGKYLYVGNGGSSNTVWVVDVSDPSAPSLVHSFSAAASNPGDIAFSGQYMYLLTSGASQFKIYDNSKITSPNLVGSISTVCNSPAPKLIVRGQFVYLTCLVENALAVVDVSNPVSPATVATTTLGDRPIDFVISGNYLYAVNNFSDEMSVVDIRNPARPTVVVTSSVIAGVSSIAMRGHYAYLGSGSGNFQVINVSNPASPSIVGTITASTVARMRIAGQYLYFTSNSNNRVEVYDLVSSTLPVLVATTTVGSYPEALVVVGRYAYVANSVGDSLSIIDVSGTETNGLIAHSAELGTANILGSTQIGGRLFVGDSLNIGLGGILSSGALGISATSTTSTFQGNLLVNGLTSLATTTISSSSITTANVSTLNVTASSNLQNITFTNATGTTMFLNGALGVTATSTLTGPVRLGNLITFTSGTTFSTSSYQIGLASSSPNTLVFSTPISADNNNATYMEWRTGGTARMTMNSVGGVSFGEVVTTSISGDISLNRGSGLSGYLFLGNTSNWVTAGIWNGNLNVRGATYNQTITGASMKIGLPSNAGEYSDISTGLGDVVLLSETGNLILSARTSSAAILFSTGAADTEKVRITTSGLVGIGITNPTAKLEVTNGAIMASGTTGATPGSGAGTRLMWIPAKAAFRAGGITGSQWDNANVGTYSQAFGINNTASGYGSAAFGDNNTATTSYSFVVGLNNSVTSSEGGFAFGVGNKMTGYYAGAMGNSNVVTSNYSYAFGNSNNTYSDASIAIGSNNTVRGYTAVALGYGNSTAAQSAVAVGESNQANGNYSFVAGQGSRVDSVGGASIGVGHYITGNYALGLGSEMDISGHYSVAIGIDGVARTLSAANTFAVVGGNSLFGTTTAPGTTYRVFIDGGVSTSPGLGVNGYIKASGYISGTTTLDLAETYPIDQSCYANGTCPETGDVVCVSDIGGAVIERCSVAYTAKAVGIVSTNPGFTLGGLGERGERKVALAGRVPVRVTTQGGVISPGDRLTASDIPGVAQKATRGGQTVAIALDAFGDGGIGTITAFVNVDWNVPDFAAPTAALDQTVGWVGEVSDFTRSIIDGLQQLGIIIRQGFIQVAELVSDKIITKQLCIGETCVTENELRMLLEKNAITNSDAASTGGGGGSNSTLVGENQASTVSTTTEIIVSPTTGATSESTQTTTTEPASIAPETTPSVTPTETVAPTSPTTEPIAPTTPEPTAPVDATPATPPPSDPAPTEIPAT